jgi:hypothetical protein
MRLLLSMHVLLYAFIMCVSEAKRWGNFNFSCKGGTIDYKEMKWWQSGRKFRERCLSMFTVI